MLPMINDGGDLEEQTLSNCILNGLGELAWNHLFHFWENMKYLVNYEKAQFLFILFWKQREFTICNYSKFISEKKKQKESS